MKLLSALCVMLAWMGATDVLANTVTPVSGQEIRLIQGAMSDADVLYVNPPNDAGYSINRFSSFKVDSKALNIVNVTNNVASVLPTTVVIIADSIAVSNRIESMGAAADIVLLSGSASGAIQCSGCSLRNFYRVTLAVASLTKTPDRATTQLGVLKGQAGGSIILDGLQAPGALSVDVMAGAITTRGQISVLDRADRAAGAKGFAQNTTGKSSIAAGGINFRSGKVFWNYETMATTGYEVGTISSTFGGSINGLAARFWSSAPATFTASVSTKVDLISTVLYRGEVRLTPEEITFSAFHSGGLSLKGASLQSAGTVNISALSSLTVAESARIIAGEAKLLAENSLFQYGEISATNVFLEAKDLINEGAVKASATASLWAENRLVNRSGGKIDGQVVRLETDVDQALSYIQNGSRTPFVSFDDYHLAYTSDYYDRLDRTQLGSFYVAKVEDRFSLAGNSMPLDTSAHIRGKQIFVRTRAFENINPYYEQVDQSTGLATFTRERQSQVSTIGESRLEVDALDYMLNASGWMGVESASGLVRLKSGIIVNERYRVYVGLDDDISSRRETRKDGYGVTESTITTESISTKVLSYSPPGILFSMGGLDAEASHIFLNSIGYLEIFGDAQFKTPRLIDRGIELQSTQRISTQSEYEGYGCSSSNGCISNRSGKAVTDPTQMDSLFYINGNARATASVAAAGTADVNAKALGVTDHADYSPFNSYIDQAIAAIIDADRGRHQPINNQGLTITLQSQGQYAGSPVVTGFTSITTDKVNMETSQFTISWRDITSYKVGDNNRTHVYESFRTYDLFTELKAFYGKLKTKITAFFNELIWWN